MTDENKGKINGLINSLINECLAEQKNALCALGQVTSFMGEYELATTKSSRIEPVVVALNEYIDSPDAAPSRAKAIECVRIFKTMDVFFKNREKVEDNKSAKERVLINFIREKYIYSDYHFTPNHKIMDVIKAEGLNVSAVMLGRYLSGLGWKSTTQNNVRGWKIRKR